MSRSPSRAAHDHQPVIAVRDLTKTYVGQVEAVKSITFDVQPGEVFGLLGPNGAGKSTTIGMLTTAIRPTSGTAHLRGIDVLRDPLGARSVSSVVFQDAVVDKALSGRRNLELHGNLWGVEREEIKLRVADVVVLMGLSDEVDRPVGTYSGGQRRRLEIGRALMSRPEVLFLDEPTVGLDPRIRFELLDLIAGLRRDSDTTVLVTTHYLDEAEALCGRIAIMHRTHRRARHPAALLAALGAEIWKYVSTATQRQLEVAASKHRRRARLLRNRQHADRPAAPCPPARRCRRSKVSHCRRGRWRPGPQ
jgi:ABC-2 type transport system ATP-binding protein